MATDYLSRTQSATFDSSGTATVTIRPDAAQWWILTMVRVSTNSQIAPIAYCAIYHGAVNNNTPSSFIDDTFQGNRDSSSMISGTVCQFGEGITAVWTNGQPDDVAIFTVYGIVCYAPPTLLDLVPFSPGSHFAGKAAENVQNLVTVSTAIVLNPVALNTTQLFDVRGYESYYYRVIATVTSTFTSYVPVEVDILWYSSVAAFLGGSVPVYQELVEIFADSTTPPFTFSGGALLIQDIMHGPFMAVSVRNNAGDTSQVSISYSLQATTRQVTSPYMRQIAGLDGILLRQVAIPIGIGQTFQLPTFYGYGRTWEKFQSIGIFTITLQAGSTVNSFDAIAFPATSTIRREYVMPKRAILYSVQNTSGAANTYSITVATEYSKQ